MVFLFITTQQETKYAIANRPKIINPIQQTEAASIAFITNNQKPKYYGYFNYETRFSFSCFFAYWNCHSIDSLFYHRKIYAREYLEPNFKKQ